MELLRSGMKQTAVARKVGVNRRTVYEWKKRIENDHDYRSRKKTGRKSHLSVDQKETLKKIIDSGALAYGYPRIYGSCSMCWDTAHRCLSSVQWKRTGVCKRMA